MAITDQQGYGKPAMAGLPTLITASTAAYAESKFLSLKSSGAVAAETAQSPNALFSPNRVADVVDMAPPSIWDAVPS